VTVTNEQSLIFMHVLSHVIEKLSSHFIMKIATIEIALHKHHFQFFKIIIRRGNIEL